MVLIPDIDAWALGVLKSSAVPATDDHSLTGLFVTTSVCYSVLQPYGFEPGQMWELAHVCVSLAGAHTEVFIAALYQLQEGGGYLIWHKIYQDKITFRKIVKMYLYQWNGLVPVQLFFVMSFHCLFRYWAPRNQSYHLSETQLTIIITTC